MTYKRPDKAAILAVARSINKREGEGTVFGLGDDESLKIARWSTGIEDLDHITGGGMPYGRVVEVYGAESSGKTTLLYHLAAQHEIALDIPVEGTFDSARARVMGCRPKQLLVYRARYGEDALNKVLKFAREGIPFIGVDSVPSLIPREDFDKVLKGAEKDTIEEQRIGGTARLLNKMLPPIEDIIEVTGTTLLFVNQVRDKMNAMLFGEKTDTPGGRKLKHSASLRIQVARKSWIEIPNHDPYNSAAKERIGMIMKCRVVKSKICQPYRECEIPLFFDRGFISFSELDAVRKSIMQDRAETAKKQKLK